MKAKPGEEAVQPSTWYKKLIWLFLVGIVPIFAAVLMVGVALQIVGVPVWKTAQVYLGMTHSSETSPIAGIQGQLATEKAKDGVLSAQNTQLTQQLDAAKQQKQDLQNQINALQLQLQTKQNERLQAKNEATVLAGMDAAAAANMLSKLSVEEAALIVSQMPSANSADILAQMDSAKAAQVLSMAAQQQVDQTNATSNTGS